MIEYHIIRLFRMFDFLIVHERSTYGDRLKSNYEDLSMIGRLLNHSLQLRSRKVVVGLG
jgi:hypothetical protein